MFFVADHASGLVQARSRTFIDIADAWWAARQATDVQTRWLTAALDTPDGYEAVQLAAGLSNDIADLLVRKAVEDGRAELLRLAVDSIGDGAAPSSDRLAALVDALIDSLRPGLRLPDAPSGNSPADKMLAKFAAAQARRDGPAWPWALRLARLPLPQDLRQRRDDALRTLPDLEQRAIGLALAAIADFTVDGRDAPPLDQQQRLRDALALDLPADTDRVEHVSRTETRVYTGSRLLSGRADVALGAAKLLEPLTSEDAERIEATAQRSSVGQLQRIEEILSRRGHAGIVLRSPRYQRLVDLAAQSSDDWSDWLRLHELVASLASHAELTQSQLWRLPEYASLLQVTRLLDGPWDELPTALGQPDSLGRLLLMYAAGADLPIGVVAAQAEVARTSHDQDRHTTLRLLVCPPAPDTESTVNVPPLTASDRTFLMGCLIDQPDLNAQLAYGLLASARDSSVALDLLAGLDGLPYPRRRMVAALILELHPHSSELIAQWLASQDPARRFSAALTRIDLLPDTNPAAASPLPDPVVELLTDADLTVREAVREALDQRTIRVPPPSDLAGASFWSCSWCGATNNLDMPDCPACSHGSRPRQG